WWYIPEAYLSTFHWCCMTALVMYTLGLGTSVTKWLAPVITISYANRAPNANFGLDQINAMLALYLALGPCGAKLSLDRLLSKWRGGANSLRLERRWNPPPVPRSSSARFSTRLIQVHMCIIYFFAGVSKLKGTDWWDGDAVWFAFANAEYQTTDMTWIAWYPWISDVFTHGTILWEMTFWFLIWQRGLRPLVLFAGIMMHLGIGACMGLWTFALIMMITYVSYIPPERFAQIGAVLMNWIRQPEPRAVAVDAASRWERNWVAARKACDLRHGMQLVVESPHAAEASHTIGGARNGETFPSDGEFATEESSPEDASVEDLETDDSMASTLARVASTPPVIAPTNLWARYRDHRGEWPFAQCERLNVEHPRVLIVQSSWKGLADLPTYFQSKGFHCRVASDMPAVCATLMERPVDAVLLIAQSSAEVSELATFRSLLISAGAAAPASVLLSRSRPKSGQDTNPSEHRWLTAGVSKSDLRREILLALRERACTSEEDARLEAIALGRPAEQEQHFNGALTANDPVTEASSDSELNCVAAPNPSCECTASPPQGVPAEDDA
ncbi:MAG: HTTM domain-containing protein, partial [Planctomycetaceae bacterium]|nr:HTTM domain-containing protein [Planctomycetaceae bacterium]